MFSASNVILKPNIIKMSTFLFTFCFVYVSFVIQDVKLGSTEPHQLSLDLDESLISGLLQQSQQPSGSSLLSGSPPHSGRTSPPVTPSSAQIFHHQQIALPPPQQQQQQPSQSFQLQSQQEPMELQLEYWPIKSTVDKDKSLVKGFDQGKCSIKGTFRSLQVHCRNTIVFNHFFCTFTSQVLIPFEPCYLQVCRLPLNPQSGEFSQGFVVNYATKEKKQKSM